MEDLLLQAPALLVTEVTDLRQSRFDAVIFVDGEVLTLGVLESGPEPLDFALGLLDGPPESVQGLPCFGLC